MASKFAHFQLELLYIDCLLLPALPQTFSQLRQLCRNLEQKDRDQKEAQAGDIAFLQTRQALDFLAVGLNIQGQTNKLPGGIHILPYLLLFVFQLLLIFVIFYLFLFGLSVGLPDMTSLPVLVIQGLEVGDSDLFEFLLLLHHLRHFRHHITH